MRIAVIGAGASGLVAAYRLQAHADVIVFEKQAEAGGHIRTLGRNVAVAALPGGAPFENGVLGFHHKSYPALHALFDEIGVDYGIGQPDMALFEAGQFFPANPKHLLSPGVLMRLALSPDYVRRLRAMQRDYAPAVRRIVRHQGADVPLGDLLDAGGHMQTLLRLFFGLAFSTPWNETPALPASLVVPYMRAMKDPDWSFVRGGVYAWIEALRARSRFALHTGLGDVRLRRTQTGVEINAGSSVAAFDAALIATSPGEVMKIVSDADAQERALFAPWRDRVFETVAHTDAGVYGAQRGAAKSPMDLFAGSGAAGPGYNSWQNGFLGLRGPVQRGFAHNLDAAIDPAKIVHRAAHRVPVYTVEAMATRAQIQAEMGRRHLWYAGAWLGNGLHEGAITSANAAAQSLTSALARVSR